MPLRIRAGRRSVNLARVAVLAAALLMAQSTRSAPASGLAPAALDAAGRAHYQASRYADALRSWEAYLRHPGRPAPDTAATRVYALLSQAAMMQRRYHRAIDYARRALAQPPPHRWLDVYRATMTLGASYDDLRRPADATYWLQRAQHAAEHLPDPRWQLYLWERLGMLMQNRKQYADALPYFRRQVALARRVHRPAFVGAAYTNLGYGELQRSRFAAAQHYLDSAAVYVTAATHPDLYPFLLKYQAEASLGLGQYARSRRFAERAVAQARAARNVGAEIEAERTLSILLDSLGQGRAALRHWQRFQALRDSVINLKEVTRIAEQERRHDLAVQAGELRFNRRQNQLLRQQQALQTAARRKDRALLLAVSASLLVIGGLLALYVRKYRQYRASTRQLAAAQVELQQQNQLKELILRETNHRIRNNFQTVISSLNLQAGHLADPEARRSLRESQGRVRAMALLHQALAQAPAADSRVALRPFTETLLADLYRGHHQPNQQVTYTADVAEVALPLNLALPYALALVELFLNALKHAFPAGHPAGTVRVEAAVEPAPQSTQLRLLVHDNGVGLPAAAVGRAGSGLELVRDLAKQLGGGFDLRPAQPGLRAELTAPLPAPYA